MARLASAVPIPREVPWRKQQLVYLAGLALAERAEEMKSRKSGMFGGSLGTRKTYLGRGLISLRGTRHITKPVDTTRLYMMTEKRRVRQRKVRLSRYGPRECDRGWHPNLCTYETEFEYDQALYFYNLFLMPWERGSWERFMDRMERKYFPDDLIDFEMDPKEQRRLEKAHAQALAEEMQKQVASPVGSYEEEEVNPVADEVPAKPATQKGGNTRLRDGRCSLKTRNVEEGSFSKRSNVREEVAEKWHVVSSPAVEDVRREDDDDWLPVTCSKEENPAQVQKDAHKTVKIVAAAADSKPVVVKRDMELPETWDSPVGTVLLVDKPRTWTSFDVCAKLRNLLKQDKVGHAGTLDPLATGLLVICLGKATKLADSYQAMTKVYSGTLRLGEATPSYDSETPVSETLPWEHIKDTDVQKAKQDFLGDIMQVPPLYSALKIEGEKLYNKARRGDDFRVPPRMVSIYEFEIERSSTDRQEFNFRVSCSKGTYIRSLCYDLGRALNNCAHMTSLRREKIGHMSVEDAWRVEELSEKIKIRRSVPGV